jgi:hypothetical protein
MGMRVGLQRRISRPLIALFRKDYPGLSTHRAMRLLSMAAAAMLLISRTSAAQRRVADSVRGFGVTGALGLGLGDTQRGARIFASLVRLIAIPSPFFRSEEGHGGSLRQPQRQLARVQLVHGRQLDATRGLPHPDRRHRRFRLHLRATYKHQLHVANESAGREAPASVNAVVGHPPLHRSLEVRQRFGRPGIDALGDGTLRLGQAGDVTENGFIAFCGLAGLALPVMATSSFAGVLPWAVFLPLLAATRFGVLGVICAPLEVDGMVSLTVGNTSRQVACEVQSSRWVGRARKIASSQAKQLSGSFHSLASRAGPRGENRIAAATYCVG